MVVQEARLTIASAELAKAQAQLDEKQAELDKAQAEYDAAMKKKQVWALIGMYWWDDKTIIVILGIRSLCQMKCNYFQLDLVFIFEFYFLFVQFRKQSVLCSSGCLLFVVIIE